MSLIYMYFPMTNPDDQAENNIKALLEELKQRYGVDEFAPVLISSANNK